MKQHLKKHKLKVKRIVVGWIALYPTLLIVLNLLSGFTHTLTMPLAILVEAIVLVPVTQLISYPLAGKVFSRWLTE